MATLSHRFARRMVEIALRAFPRDFRDRHGADALQYFDDRAGERLRRGGAPGLIGLVASNVADIVAAGLAERRARWSGPRMAGIPADVRYAVRALRRRPGFVVSAVVPIALGMAGITSVFAVIDAVVLRPLPYPDAEALVAIGRPLPNGMLATILTANLIDLEEPIPGLEAVGGVQGGVVTTKGTDPELVHITRPTRRFMEIFRLSPVVGRGFVADDFTNPQVALVTWPYVQRRWGSDTAAIGSTIDTDMGTFRVVGILPRTWQPPEALSGAHGEIWIPIDYGAPTLETGRAFGLSSGVGRLTADARLASVNDRLHAAALALWRAYSTANTERDGSPKGIEARPLHTQTVGDIGPRLALLLGAVVLLLATACANVANLFLARGAERTRELAMRGVLGASRGRLIAQLLVESVIIAILGGAVGLLLAVISLDSLVALTPDLPRAGAVSVDLRVAWAAFALSLLSGIAFGIFPALTTPTVDPASVLRGGSQPGRGADRLRGALVVGQTALALVLVTGGGLLVNSVVRLALVDPGFDASSVLTIRPRLNPRIYDRDAPATPFFRRFTDGLADAPGIREVSGTMFVPGQGLPLMLSIESPAGDEPLRRWGYTVLPGFFDLLRIPIIEGRALTDADRPGAMRAAVVSASLARELWPGESAIGRAIRTDNGEEKGAYTVVGVAADIHSRGPHFPVEPVLYESFEQNPWLSSLDILIRHDGDAEAIMPAIREAQRAADPTVPLADVIPLDDILADNTVEARHYAILLGVFSLIALTIAAVGVYPTVSYAVARRMREMGIRRAVGAGGREVAGLVLRRGMMEALAGAAIGIALALAAARMLDSLLFGITTSDPLTYALVAALLLASALVACVPPAVRAMNADPLEILRAD